MQNIDVYLHFNGNCEQAFLFYQSVFGGDFITRIRYKDMPGSDKMEAGNQEKMMHISLKIAPQTTLMGTDTMAKNDNELMFGNNFHICIQASNVKEADNFFQLLSHEGKIEMPMNKTFWGAYFGMCLDKFGIFWMINFNLNPTN